ncbi:carbohydrate ABC transporter permease [Paenibacillus aceris]|uniref:Multiple sugar transport system permease protein n=2 Tax=Paenibacillus aceris TaxID=869555 RepID=A0ABS4HW60_9BACL|nr:carbohydrate ABC transporter permease [Paenibacillus aceris]MBP1962783.1 multiple sugar transport system permease protein [Paenibacillus aceris]NHW33855.1 carbohydrate ABC transporter permease [Paenibacillus aceris]
MLQKKSDVSKWITTLMMGLFSLIFLLPLLWMLSAAAKYEKDVMVFPIQWIPTKWNLVNNFREVWFGSVPFTLFYYNSLKLALMITLATLIFSSMAAFAFTKLQFRGRNMAFAILLSLMIIPSESTLVPRYLLLKWLHLYNTHAGLMLMGMFSTIYFTFLLRQFMASIHSEYLEAAKIDGAGYVRMYLQIIMPLSKPILATVAIIKFIWVWNDYQNPLIFLISKQLYPIPLGLQLFKNEFADNYAVLMMASVAAIFPLFLIFIILQKQVIKGISLGGVKG